MLMVVAALVMAVITLFEARENSGQVPFRYYTSFWFILMLGLVWLNLLSNMMRAFWWKWRRMPLSLFHLGFLLILTGGFLTWAFGMRGHLRIMEGEKYNAFQHELPVLHVSHDENSEPRQVSFLLQENGALRGEGYLGWARSLFSRGATTLSNGQTITVLDRMESARIDRRVERAESGEGPAAVKLEITMGRTDPLVMQAGQVQVLNHPRLSRIIFRHAGKDGTGEDVFDVFNESVEIRPPEGAPINFPLSVPDDVGKTFTQGGYTLEVLEYHPDFKVGKTPDPNEPPRNPALRLKVDGPNGGKTLFAFALVEFHGNRLDDGTEVAYQRPGAGQTLLLVSRNDEFVEAYQDASGTPVRLDSETPLTFGEGREQIDIALAELWPGSRRVEEVVPDAMGNGMPAFYVRIGEDGEPRWLLPGQGRVVSTDGFTQAVVDYFYDLGFEIVLDDAMAEFWPASSIPRAYYSHVRVKLPEDDQEREAIIETNNPLRMNQFRLYQSDMDHQPPYRFSGFSVASDPGVPCVTLGFILLCLGMVWFFWRQFIVRPIRSQGGDTASAEGGAS